VTFIRSSDGCPNCGVTSSSTARRERRIANSVERTSSGSSPRSISHGGSHVIVSVSMSSTVRSRRADAGPCPGTENCPPRTVSYSVCSASSDHEKPRMTAGRISASESTPFGVSPGTFANRTRRPSPRPVATTAHPIPSPGRWPR
jgi:hypothetical protein